jgi:hypothetical protein
MNPPSNPSNPPTNPSNPTQPTQPTMPPNYTGPTFYKDVQPIIRDKCELCHHDGGLGPVAFSTYDQTKTWAPLIQQRTADKSMPPWGASNTTDCQVRFPFVGDMSLSDDQIKTIGDWVSMGTVAGNPADAPAEQTYPPIDLANANVELQPKSEWIASGDTDQFRCFAIDPGFTQETYVNGVFFVPGNKNVVHHALVFLDPNREGLGMAGPDGSYDCFGGPNVSNTGVVLAWAPGVPPTDLGNDTAFDIPANSALVLQVHYHPAGGTDLHDRSTIKFRTFNGRPDWIMQLALIGNASAPEANGDGLLPDPANPSVTPKFLIPAGDPDFVVRQRFTLPATSGGFPLPALKVPGAGTHMHYVGTDMRVEIQHMTPLPGEPARECLLETPRWDFNWQRGYAYNVPIDQVPQWRPGDQLFLTCHYNNTTSNPHVMKALLEQGLSAPRDVSLGEQTLDEMCLAVLAIVFQNYKP